MNPFKAFLRNNLKVLGIGWGLLSRSQASNVARFYAVGPEEVAEFLGGRLLNFGLWETRRESHQEAARSLLHRVATLARLDAAEAVVDAGCGFGQPAMEFHSSYGARRVLGLNVTRCQLDHAA